MTPLQVGIFLIWKGHVGSCLHLLLVLLEDSLVDLDFWRCEGWRSDEIEGLVADKLASEPASVFISICLRLCEAKTYRNGFSKL